MREEATQDGTESCEKWAMWQAAGEPHNGLALHSGSHSARALARSAAEEPLQDDLRSTHLILEKVVLQGELCRIAHSVIWV